MPGLATERVCWAQITRARSPLPGNRASSCFLAWVVVLASLYPLCAQLPSQTVSARSYSGQFIVQAPASILTAPSPRFETNRSFLRLEPSLLPVGCERAKQLLWRDLDLSGPWAGKIFVTVYLAMAPDDPVTVVTDAFRDGWQYRLSLPNVIDRTRYVRALVSAVLLEIANRGATDRAAELPAWLVEGLTQELLASGEAEILLPAPKLAPNGIGVAATVRDAREENPLARAHKLLVDRTPLSFQQLSWPEDQQLEGEAGEIYRANAQLLVVELLRFKDGRACLRNMLAELPRHYNWQFAFLRAFGSHFQRPLDVEKWWTLTALHFTGRDLAETWSPPTSWQKLDEVVRSRVQVQAATNQPPMESEVSLQTIVRDWDRVRQLSALRQKLSELDLLRQRVSAELLPVVDEYRRVLSEFLAVEPGGLLRKKAVERHWREQTLKELDRLDARRVELRSGPSADKGLQAVAPVPGR